MNAVPDVSVIVAVYNTMPYLTACIESLLGQSIGPDRLQIIAVDDGSTDGSSEALDAYARDHRCLTVLHQPNSGGPAQPSNRGLDAATGRFVYFIGADDYLGAEALERLVTAADEWGSDVIFGTMVGTSGRRIPNAIFESTKSDIDLYDSELPFLLSNTKLFRRDLIEKHGIRFPEGLPLGSDQPFTVSALVHSRRTSVLTGYTFYYAVKREDLSNISYSRTTLERANTTRQIMDFIAGLIEPGERRDAVLKRHFLQELSRCLHMEFFDGHDQSAVTDVVGRLVEDYLTDTVRRALAIQHRVRFELARTGNVDLLREVILTEFGPERHRPPFVRDGDEVFMGYPGFGADGVDDRAYRVGHRRFVEPIEKALRAETRIGSGLCVSAELPIISRHGDDVCEVVLLPLSAGEAAPETQTDKRAFNGGRVLAQAPYTTPFASGSSTLEVPIDPAALLHERANRRTRATLRLRFQLGGSSFDFPIPGPAEAATLTAVERGRRYVIECSSNEAGALIIECTPPRHVWMSAALIRRVRQFGRRRR